MRKLNFESVKRFSKNLSKNSSAKQYGNNKERLQKRLVNDIKVLVSIIW